MATQDLEISTVPLPPEFEGMVLLDITDLCSIYRASRSYVYNEIAEGRMPAPAVKLGQRFTRWRAADIHAHLQALLNTGERGNAGLLNARRATLASLAAAAKRARSAPPQPA
jgi:predicted DNA-binding transcriptional regulator AlpA